MSEKPLFTPAGPPEHPDVEKQFETIILSAADQRTQGWHEIRRGRITSSEFGLLFKKAQSADFAKEHFGFGKSAASYLSRLAMEMYCGQDLGADIGEKWELKWGRIFEPCAVRFFELKTNHRVNAVNFIPYGDNAGGSPDFISDQFGVGENKCPANSSIHAMRFVNIRDIQTLKKDDLDIYWQLCANMYFTGIPYGVFLSFDPRQTTQAWTDIDLEGYSPEYAWEISTEKEKKLALLQVEVEMPKEVPDMIEDAIDRGVKLRNRFLEQIQERFKAE